MLLGKGRFNKIKTEAKILEVVKITLMPRCFIDHLNRVKNRIDARFYKVHPLYIYTIYI